MTMLRRMATVCLALTLATGLSSAQELTEIRFTLDWKVQGPHAWFYLARDKGYFRAAGLVTIDEGEGSAATVTRIMSGAYDAGFGDMNAIGVGDDDKRMAAAIATVADAYQLPRKPELGEVFDRSFLPPKATRMLKLAGK
jgi:NitT/TauT family transport system substrate-binding protein